jgi:hypothetical protein
MTMPTTTTDTEERQGRLRHRSRVEAGQRRVEIR